MTDRVPRLVVDADPGIDDVLALLTLAHHHAAGRIALELVTVVGGNAPLAQVAANARWALDAGGLPGVPVRAGAAEPLGGPRVSPLGRNEIHGDDGVGGWFPAGRPAGDPEGGGVAALVAALRPPTDGPRWLLATGPLTNVALALDAEPGLATAIERVVVMGGALGDPPGNITATAEFNLCSDPHAARRVLTADLPLTLVPLDVTLRVLLTTSDAGDLERRAGGPTLASGLLRTSIANNGRVRGLAGAPVHDALAAAVVLAPSIVRTEPRRLDVVVEGPDAGQVVEGGGAPPVEVAVDVDAARARALLLAALAPAR
jgi:inosine-uridine nucleoside N-ribohydrolase